MRFRSMSSRLAAIAVVILVPGAMLSASSPARASASSPARAAATSVSPTLTVSTNLTNRRYVASGDRAYELGSEDGRYPAMGFHTRGEMGGIWTPPIKLLDGIWFGVNGTWIGPATSFTSGFGHVQMTLPQATTGPANNLQITRTDFVPDGRRAVEIGLTLHLPVDGSDKSRELLPFLFLKVKLQGLEKCVIRILRHPGIAELQSAGEIAVGPKLAHFRIGIVKSIVFGANLVVKILIAGPLRTGRIGSPPV